MQFSDVALLGEEEFLEFVLKGIRFVARSYFHNISRRNEKTFQELRNL
ncbi:MAG: hypothetical protein ACE1ZC_05035 [Nitrososphaerales archaeon]